MFLSKSFYMTNTHYFLMTDYARIIAGGLEGEVDKSKRARVSDFVAKFYKSCSNCGERYIRGYSQDDRFCSKECSYNYDA